MDITYTQNSSLVNRQQTAPRKNYPEQSTREMKTSAIMFLEYSQDAGLAGKNDTISSYFRDFKIKC